MVVFFTNFAKLVKIILSGAWQPERIARALKLSAAARPWTQMANIRGLDLLWLHLKTSLLNANECAGEGLARILCAERVERCLGERGMHSVVAIGHNARRLLQAHLQKLGLQCSPSVHKQA